MREIFDVFDYRSDDPNDHEDENDRESGLGVIEIGSIINDTAASTLWIKCVAEEMVSRK